MPYEGAVQWLTGRIAGRGIRARRTSQTREVVVPKETREVVILLLVIAVSVEGGTSIVPVPFMVS